MTYSMTPAEQALADAADAEQKAAYRRALQSMAGMLYSADPDCDHEVVGGDNYSGIKCSKCRGWYCA